MRHIKLLARTLLFVVHMALRLAACAVFWFFDDPQRPLKDTLAEAWETTSGRKRKP